MSNDVFVGLDWAVHTHAVCVIDATGSVLDRFEFAHDRDGLAELMRRLARWGERLGIAKDGEEGVSVTQEIRPLLKDIEARLPSGCRIDVGSAVEEGDKANQALLAVAPLMVVTILLLLMLQLQDFSRMWMVVLTAPLGLIGVVPALLVFHAPLGFVAILGIIALGGMIMRNSVILIDQVQTEIAEGRDPWNAVLDAAIHRTRPVVLTALAAVLEMVPLTRSVFWGLMAIVIMGGLTVATLLTIFFVPALYAAWFKVRRQPAGGTVPAPGEVAPGA